MLHQVPRPLADCLAVLPGGCGWITHPSLFAEALARAVVGGRRVEVVYHTAERDGEDHAHPLSPYHLMIRDDAWYVIAHDDFRNTVRVFSVQPLSVDPARRVRPSSDPPISGWKIT